MTPAPGWILNLMTEREEVTVERQFLLEKDEQVNELKKKTSEISTVSSELIVES